MSLPVKIGITERGDGGLDLSWEKKIDTVDGVLVVTKCPGRKELHEALLRHKNKCLLHATITGNGGSYWEPNVPNGIDSVNSLWHLMQAGFPADRIILRCDPVIPRKAELDFTRSMLWHFCNMNLDLKKRGQPMIRRIRMSILDNYPHVRERCIAHGKPVLYDGCFSPSYSDCYAVLRMLRGVFGAAGNPGDYEITTCAEPMLVNAYQSLTPAEKAELPVISEAGCVDIKELKLLGIADDRIDESLRNRQNRQHCRCLAAKTELLSNRQQCPHQCLYCYWKQPHEIKKPSATY